MRRAISPVIATVILIAVTIVIGIAVAGWLMGVWGGFGATESLRIYPNYTLDQWGHFNLYVANVGGSSTRIIKITVGNYDCKTFDFPGEYPIINPGQKRPIYCRVIDKSGSNVTLTPGTDYVARIMTEAGNIYTLHVRVR